MTGKIYITGLGVISAIGKNVKENLSSLRAQKSGLDKIKILETNYKDDFVAGEVKLTNDEMAIMQNISPELLLPRTTLLALFAAREAYEDAMPEVKENIRIGLVAGTTVGGMEKTEKYYYNLQKNSDFIKSHSCGSITEQVAAFLNINDYVSTFNTACSSGANAILHGANLIKNNILDVVIAGGFDSLSKFTINGFKSLFILSPGPCSPFDRNRQGLNLGEGAGFVVLASEEMLMKTGKKPYCELSGYDNANDAFHQTASSENGEGAFLSMANALQMAGLKPGKVNYINVHGTGTENNDLSEAIALKRLFGNEIPPFSSTKPFIGHTLGAAGGIEAVYSVLSVSEQLIYPNLNFKVPLDEINVQPVRSIISGQNIKHVMSNSFGFGGNCTCLIFSGV